MAKYEDHIQDHDGDRIRVIAFDRDERGDTLPIIIGMEGSYGVGLTVEQARRLIDILGRAIAMAEAQPSASPTENAKGT